MDRPAVLRILARTKPGYRRDMASFVVHHRPDLNEFVGKCLEYLRRMRGLYRVLAKIVCHNICCLISAMYPLGRTKEFAQAVLEPPPARRL